MMMMMSCGDAMIFCLVGMGSDDSWTSSRDLDRLSVWDFGGGYQNFQKVKGYLCRESK